MKKIILFLSVLLVSILALSPNTYAKSSFPDVDESQFYWALDSINFMIGKGVIGGYPDGTFQPERAVDKAELTVMIYRLFDKYRPNRTTVDYYRINGFHDVPKTHWAYREISDIVTVHMWNTSYVTDNVRMFEPDRRLTRIGMVNMLPDIYEQSIESNEIYRILVGMKDVPVKLIQSGRESGVQDDRYESKRDITNEIFPIIFEGMNVNIDDYSAILGRKLASLQKTGIMTAWNGEFEAHDPLTRAEAVTILHRLYLYLQRTGELSKYSSK